MVAIPAMLLSLSERNRESVSKERPTGNLLSRFTPKGEVSHHTEDSIYICIFLLRLNNFKEAVVLLGKD